MEKRLSFDEWAKANGHTVQGGNSEQVAKAVGGYADYVGGYIAGLANKDADAAKALATDFKQAFEPMRIAIDSANEVMKAQGIELQKLKDKVGMQAPSEGGELAQKANIKGIRAVMKSSEEFEITTKATTTRASVVNNGLALDLPEVGQLATRRNSFYEFLAANGRIFNVPPSANGTVRYIDWDSATTVRAAAMVAEGAAFPESTAAWQTYTIQLKKIGDMLPWTDEFEYDDAFLVSELQQFLLINIALIKNSQMINGDGTGQNLSGIITVAPTYTPVAAAISDASIYDLFVKLRETIEAQTGAKYRTNFALMNIVDINRYKLKKDANDNYIMPPFYDAAGNRIDGVTVIEDNAVTANTMFIGDVNYTRFYAANGVIVKRGYINDDFGKGLERLRVYERGLFLIRVVDRTGFLKVTNITTALATLAS